LADISSTEFQIEFVFACTKAHENRQGAFEKGGYVPITRAEHQPIEGYQRAVELLSKGVAAAKSLGFERRSFLLRGILHYTAGDLKNAHKDFSRCAEMDRNDAESLALLAVIDNDNGDHRAARKQCKAALTAASHGQTEKRAWTNAVVEHKTSTSDEGLALTYMVYGDSVMAKANGLSNEMQVIESKVAELAERSFNNDVNLEIERLHDILVPLQKKRERTEKKYMGHYATVSELQEKWAEIYLGIGLHNLQAAHLLACLDSIFHFHTPAPVIILCAGLPAGVQSLHEASDAVGLQQLEFTALCNSLPAALKHDSDAMNNVRLALSSSDSQQQQLKSSRECAALNEASAKSWNEASSNTLQHQGVDAAAYDSDARTGLSDKPFMMTRKKGFHPENQGREVLPATDPSSAHLNDDGTVTLGTFLGMPQIDHVKDTGTDTLGAWKDSIDLSPSKTAVQNITGTANAVSMHTKEEMLQVPEVDEKTELQGRLGAISLHNLSSSVDMGRRENDSKQDMKYFDEMSEQEQLDQLQEFVETSGRNVTKREFWSSANRRAPEHVRKRFEMQSGAKAEYYSAEVEAVERDKWNRTFESRLDSNMSEVYHFCDYQLRVSKREFDDMLFSVEDEMLHSELAHKLDSVYIDAICHEKCQQRTMERHVTL